jgi:hypothetical protein
MENLEQNSLVQTVEYISEAFLLGKKIDKNSRISLAKFIVEQQDKPNCYAHTFAPTEFDLTNEFRLFTGEKVNSKVGLCHILGEEASVALRRLNLGENKIELAIEKANKGLNSFILKYKHLYPEGMYCCKTCSCALWLNIGTDGVPNQKEMLNSAMKILKNNRDNNGKWKGFNFYYTLYVLNSIDNNLSFKELQYASLSIEKRLKKMNEMEGKYGVRRKAILEQILEKIN